MSKLPGHTRQAWQSCLLVVGLLLSRGQVWGQTTHPAMARLVRPTAGTRPLGDVLDELSRQSRLPLTYSSSLVPVAHLSHLTAGPARPLGAVLEEVLASENLSFGLLNGQLVVWPAKATVPVGVVAVNGRSLGPAHSPLSKAGASSKATANHAVSRVGVAASISAASSRSSIHPIARLDSERLLSSQPQKQPAGTIARPKTGIAKDQKIARRPSPDVPAAAPIAPPRSEASVRSGVATRNGSQSSATTRVVSRAKPLVSGTRTAAISLKPGAAPSPGRAVNLRPGARAALNSSMASSAPSTTITARVPGTSQPPVARQAQSSLRSVRTPVTLLSPVVAALNSPLPDRLPPSIQVPSGPGLSPEQNPVAGIKPSALPDATKHFTLASLLRPNYLHGEAWGSETLPLGGTLKVGIPRLYLALSVAAGPLGRENGGDRIAWGGGLGTVGQPRGRFTPSLDLLYWSVAGNRNSPGNQLIQLRSLLAWQIKEAGRWQLVAGPTLNLATLHREGPASRGQLGQGQWLWLNTRNGPDNMRLWPGLQVGIRF